MTAQETLDQGVAELALPLPAGARERLLQYVELLAKWNRTYNLTAIREPKDMVTHHLLDSLAVVDRLPMRAGEAIADVGSGAGLPGIPIAIARPEWRVTLNDASEKRVAFLRQAGFDLGLANVSVQQGRVEDWRPAERFAVAISRAFAELAQFIAACRHLVASGGVLAAMKGARPDAELERVGADCDCSQVLKLQVPLLEGQRHLVLCKV